MNLKLKRLGPLSVGKIVGALYFAMGLLFAPFMMLFMGIGAFASAAGGQDAPGMPLFFGMGIGAMIFVPVFYGVLGFVFGALGAWLYNLFARWIGGIELEFEETVVPPRL